MRLTSLITTIIGLGMAAGAAYYSQVGQVAPATAALPDTVDVLTLAQDVPLGAAIEAAHLSTIAWPADAVPPGAITDPARVLPEPGGAPRHARRALAAGDLLLAARLSDFGEPVTIAHRLGANNRAIAIEVDARSGVGGFVSPGNHVDVVLTQGRNADMSAVTVLQNIRVIGVDQKSDESADMPAVARTVTVEVTPEQSQRLALAQRAGQLILTLRSLDSADAAPMASVNLADILPQDTEEAEAAPAPQPEPKRVIRVMRGVHDVELLELN